MARKAGTKGTRGKRAASRPADPESAAIEAALRLAAEKGWARVSLAEVAEASGLKMSELYARFPSKQAILDGLGRQVDREVLEAVDSEAPEGSARDRLFDVLMRRFDALEAHRDGLKAVLRSTACDPLALLCGAFGLRRSMAAMLEAAGLSASGVVGLLRIKGVSAVYLMTLRAWLGDDSADKAHTMAVLDRALRRAESWASMFGRTKPARSAA